MKESTNVLYLWCGQSFIFSLNFLFAPLFWNLRITFICSCVHVYVSERERERDLTCWTLASICQLWESFHIISLVTFSTLLPFFFNSKLDGGLAVPVLLISSSVVCNTFETPWTVAYQAPLSMGFSKQEYWSGLPFPSLGDLPGPGIEPMSPALTSMFFTTESPGNPTYL